MPYYKIASGLSLLTSITLILLPRIFPICNALGPNGLPMRCHYAFQAEFLLSLIAIIVSLGLFVVKTHEARVLSSLLLAFLGAGTALLPQPWLIGICAHAGSCHKTAFFAAIAGSVLIVAAAAVALASNRLQQKLTAE